MTIQNEKDELNRHVSRTAAVICVYQYLIWPRDAEILLEDAEEADIRNDEYMGRVVDTAVREKDRYIGYINQVLEHWTFDRLGVIEQAILLCGCAEFDLKTVEMPVIIDEYVRIARKYGDKDSHKLINGVLDRI